MGKGHAGVVLRIEDRKESQKVIDTKDRHPGNRHLVMSCITSLDTDARVVFRTGLHTGQKPDKVQWVRISEDFRQALHPGDINLHQMGSILTDSGGVPCTDHSRAVQIQM